jgi:UDPglucose 6-dehydrogenase
MHKIGIIGAGFVGTACEIGFSNMPNTQVLIYDKYKPTDSLRTVVSDSNILFICLPTPMHEDGTCNTSIVAEGVSEVAACSRAPKTIVIKSTVPPGTTNELQLRHPNHHLFFNPEFLTEKNFIEDFANQQNIFLGDPVGVKGAALKSAKGLRRTFLNFFYRDFTRSQKNPGKLVWTTAANAEMLKYAANSFLAAKVSFFNEISEICEVSDVRYNDLKELLLLDPRIGATHLNVPGPDGQRGFGGSCFPKDVNALIAYARDKGVDPLVLESVWAKNLMVRKNCEWEDLPQVTGKYRAM